jgi:hypothetical protein
LHQGNFFNLSATPNKYAFQHKPYLYMAFRLKSPTERGVINEVQVLLVLNATFNNTYISVNIVVADFIREENQCSWIKTPNMYSNTYNQINGLL